MDLIVEISDVALTLSVIVGLFFGVIQVRAAERDRRESLALGYLSNFQSREFAELLRYMSSHKIPQSVEELRALPEIEQVMYVQLSQQMETLGLLVAQKLIGLGLIDRTLGSYVTLAWKNYKTLTTIIRASDPYQGEYFQWLAEQIERTQRENPRQPFYLQGRTVV